MRIRTIKPEFWTSLDIAELTVEERLTFIGLWNYADDEGKGLDDARLICSTLYPFDADTSPDEVVEHIAAIERVGMLERYEVAGRRYFRIGSWHKHQSISRPQVSRLPDPDGTVQGRVSDTLLLEGKGTGNREGKGYTPEFEAFWHVYPLRKGKAAASKAFERARSRVSVDEIIAGAERYRDDPSRKPGYTKYAEGWLSAERWTDEVGEPLTKTARLLALADRQEAEGQ